MATKDEEKQVMKEEINITLEEEILTIAITGDLTALDMEIMRIIRWKIVHIVEIVCRDTDNNMVLGETIARIEEEIIWRQSHTTT